MSVQRYGVLLAVAGAVIKMETRVVVFTLTPNVQPAASAPVSSAHATVEVLIVSDVAVISAESSTDQSSVVPAG